MSPEERACDLMNRYSLVWGLETASDRGLQSMIEAIATAIREAEDAAYERAAVAVMTARRGMSCFLTTDDCQRFNMGVVAAETAVLNLKS
jgi:hypothetical protein